MQRLWDRDANLWTGTDEAKWLGWLDIVAEQFDHLEALKTHARDVESGGFSDALLLGMGGSSLAPEVLSCTFGQQIHHPRFHVLDSTDPAQVRTFEQRVDLSRPQAVLRELTRPPIVVPVGGQVGYGSADRGRLLARGAGGGDEEERHPDQHRRGPDHVAAGSPPSSRFLRTTRRTSQIETS